MEKGGEGLYTALNEVWRRGGGLYAALIEVWGRGCIQH